MNVTWSQGDSNYDFEVDFADLVTLAQSYGKSVTTDGSIALDAAMGTDAKSITALDVVRGTGVRQFFV